MRFAIEYCRRFDMQKIFYIAPYMSILEQNSDEIRGLAGDDNFLEHHSNFIANIDNENELLEYELRTEKWDMPVISTTMVQFLNSLFDGKTSSVRRMHRLSRCVIIIDEVQSIPVRCINIFNLAMNFLAEICGCTIVLCSATQPVFNKLDFPLILDKNESMTGNYSMDFELFHRTDIISCIRKYGYSYEEAAEFCFEKLNVSGDLLVIVNTKSAARNIYCLMKEMELPENTEIIHLSANMCPEHRQKCIEKMNQLLCDKKPVMCITTQLIEAGVDISFKCVVRSLAGLDNIAQAAGRCNRHGESDDPCPIYIINIRDENISRLHEIKEAQSASRSITKNELYHDYAAVDTLSAYYDILFNGKTKEMLYKISDPDTTLLDLLSLNEKWHNEALNADYRYEQFYAAQAFKTAGRIFEVIDSRTVSVIVPFDKNAEEIILKLNSQAASDRPEYAARLLRQAQKYTVSLYQENSKRFTEQDALYHLSGGAIALKKEFYSKEYGVTAEGSEMETLIF